MQLKGFIRNTSTRNGKSKKPPYKPWTSYNAEIHSDDGQVTRISFGFDRPDVSEGDYVRLEAFEKNGFLEVDQSTMERLEAPKQATPPPAQTEGSGTSGNGVIAGKAKEDFAPQQYGYKTNPEDAKRMTFSASNDRAVQVVQLLLANDALPHSKAKGKGGEAQRYEEIMAAIDKITVKFFNDTLTLRSLEVVADEGVISTKPSSKLPEDEQQPEAGDGLDD